MNNKDLLKAIGDIDEKYLIEETDIEETNRIASNNKVNIMKKLKYILAPICIVFIAVIGLYKSGIFTSKPDIIISKKDDWIIKEVQVDKKDTPTDTAVIPKWNEMSISQQFNEVEYNNSKYSSRITKISNNNILKNIGNATLTGYDTYTETTYNKKAELYSIKDIEEKCAIAIKFEGDTDYYVYVNSYYRPTTLGEFTKDLNLEEITSQEALPNNTLFLKKENGKYGYVDKKGNVIVDYIYDDATEQNSYGFVSVKKDGLWGSIDKNGKTIIEPKYNLENNLKIDFIGKWYLGEEIGVNYYCDK